MKFKLNIKRKKETDTAPGKVPFKKKKKWKKLVAVLLILVIALLVWYFLRSDSAPASGVAGTAHRTAVVQRQDITSELSSSGTISPKDTYEITSLVEGEVISADFEEGDMVTEGQVLYQIDTSSMDTELTSRQNSLARAQENYNEALEDYNEAEADYSGNTYKSTETGYIQTLNVKAGDKINSGTQIAAVYDDTTMTIKLPFLTGDAAQIGSGSTAVLTLTDTGEQLTGTVTAVSNMDITLTGGRIVRYVTIEVANPGGLTTDMAATGSVGDFVCAMEAVFEPKLEGVMTADLPASVEIGEVLVHEGDYVTKGTPIFTIETRSAEKLMDTYKDALQNAQEALESAESNLESTQDTYDNYTITAPISGQVVTKNVKAGDNITRSSSESTTLAVIYDMSGYTFEMSVDELDVSNVKVGQSVVVTADAVEGKTFSGTVTNVSLQGSYSNGVTNYPVTVTLNDGMDELLPSMNVDGVIIIDQVQDVLAIPVDALMRGNKVYVKDESVTEAQGNVPAGFRAVEVTTGLISDEYVEITSGLEEGQEVYVAESTVDSSSAMMMPMGGGFEGGAPGGGRGGGPQGGPR
ncbi:MAG TPA: HlyD family efflux transporter periplasmic adaptor subunit [Candidatus Hungatella pullicola]|nr:HlyD family efflux transporter periplasmic adaptor subunit [Candidatus Hungatella pullicola]